MEPVVYVFDASAITRYLENAAGSSYVAALFPPALTGRCQLQISAVNWGEVYLACNRIFVSPPSKRVDAFLASVPLQVVPATLERSKRAALIRMKYGIGYADCFGIELASDSTDHILVTADFGAKKAANDIHIEFLPAKPKPGSA